MKTNLIVQCGKCKHQYRVDEKRVGERFHCFCGHTIQIPSVKIHDAAVVRCSSCGGARGKEGEPFCRYCGSSFTLHEQDLNTICPSCFTRISSKATYCHSCATPIAAESIFEDTDLQCPSCDHSQLHSRQFEGQNFSFKECNSCAGIWVSNEIFKHLEKEAKLKAISGMNEKNEIKYTTSNEKPANPKNFYRKCPYCEVMMNRKNYAGSSGIVLDVCKTHGVWFDIHELDQIVNYIQSGKLQQQQQKESRKAKQVENKAKLAEQRARSQQAKITYHDSSQSTSLFDLSLIHI